MKFNKIKLAILLTLLSINSNSLYGVYQVCLFGPAGVATCAAVAAIGGAVWAGMEIARLRGTRTYMFHNNTDEYLDVEIPLVALAAGQNRFAEKIAPGETRKIETSGDMERGFNIWRTFRNRKYPGLLGVVKITGNPSIGEFTISKNDAAWGDFKPSGDILSENAQNQIWNKLNENNQKLIKKGGYNLESKLGDYKIEFLQGSDAAWSNTLPSKIKDNK